MTPGGAGLPRVTTRTVARLPAPPAQTGLLEVLDELQASVGYRAKKRDAITTAIERLADLKDWLDRIE